MASSILSRGQNAQAQTKEKKSCILRQGWKQLCTVDVACRIPLNYQKHCTRGAVHPHSVKKQKHRTQVTIISKQAASTPGSDWIQNPRPFLPRAGLPELDTLRPYIWLSARAYFSKPQITTGSIHSQLRVKQFHNFTPQAHGMTTVFFSKSTLLFPQKLLESTFHY